MLTSCVWFNTQRLTSACRAMIPALSQTVADLSQLCRGARRAAQRREGLAAFGPVSSPCPRGRGGDAGRNNKEGAS